MLTLRAMNPADAREEYECLRELAPENGFENPYHEIPYERFEAEVIPRCMDAAKGIGVAPGRVPDTWYFLWDGDRAVALFKLRHHLNDFLRQRGGHIGYAVREGYRGRGYATQGLALMVEEARGIIPEEEIYLSCHKDNPASLKVMLKCGAYIHHEDDREYYTRIKL